MRWLMLALVVCLLYPGPWRVHDAVAQVSSLPGGGYSGLSGVHPWIWEETERGRWSLIFCMSSCPRRVLWDSRCLTGPIVYSEEDCSHLDLDMDGDVDLMDYGIHQLLYRPDPTRFSISGAFPTSNRARATSLVNSMYDSDDD